MTESKEELKGTKTLCDLVYQNITTESHCYTIHRSQIKPRLSFVPVTSKFYNKNRRTIDLKDCK